MPGHETEDALARWNCPSRKSGCIVARWPPGADSRAGTGLTFYATNENGNSSSLTHRLPNHISVHCESPPGLITGAPPWPAPPCHAPAPLPGPQKNRQAFFKAWRSRARRPSRSRRRLFSGHHFLGLNPFFTWKRKSGRSWISKNHSASVFGLVLVSRKAKRTEVP